MTFYKILLPALYCLSTISNVSSSTNSESGFSLDKFNRYNEIVSYIKGLEKDHRDIAKMESIGDSYEGRSIPGIKISSKLKQRSRPMILVDAGIHAREWMSPAVALRLIHELVENPSNKYMIENVDWFIVPLVNPDGYEYAHTNNRLWRKNRSRGKRCRGVDLNRNFGFHWMEEGSSNDECKEDYAGAKAFSEPESKNLKRALTKYKSQVKLYVTMHSYGPLILYPWSFTGSQKPDNVEEHAALAKKVADTIKRVGRTVYQVGASTEIFSTISGVSDDWAKGVLGIPLIYTIELPPGGKSGFDPPTSDIEKVGTETFAGYKDMHKHVENKWGQHSGQPTAKKRTMTHSKRTIPKRKAKPIQA